MRRDRKVDARLKKLEDREAIWRLIAEFREQIDRREFGAVAALFAARGQLISNLGPPATGPIEIERLLEAKLERLAESRRTFHQVTNSVIEVDGDEGSAKSNWCYINREADDRPMLAFVGRYSDRFIREEGTWRFQQRAITVEIPYEA
jgi:hypothetical protein